MDRTARILQFIERTAWLDLPASVQTQVRRCLLDTLGAAIAARQTKLSTIIHEFAAATYGGGGAQLWLDGRQVSPPGASLANGMTIDALDIHDGYTLTKGHAGAAVVPAALATLSLGTDGKRDKPGQELLASLAVGYEVALRAGRSLHATACDYHTSGAWNALGCAAITSRRLGSDANQIRHALGIAEYHGPRSQMMRCIDFPTMVKDGSGWGAMAGVSAGLMARAGFTGAPALTVEGREAAGFWQDLGEAWLLADQYFKPYAVCRWAQPAMVGAMAIRRQAKFEPAQIRRIRVHTFDEGVRLACRRPATTEEAQYSLPFSVATALLHGRVGPEELDGEALSDPRALVLSEQMELVPDAAYNALFPRERWARVEIELTGGELLDSGPVEATWGSEAPPSNAELRQKFTWLAQYSLSPERAAELEEMIWHCDELDDLGRMLYLLTSAADKPAEERPPSSATDRERTIPGSRWETSHGQD